jgi:hypothetical protein
VKLPFCGGLFLFSLFALAGCLAPMTQRQAQGYAQRALRGYCSAGAPCRFVKAQHMQTGWLLDYESGTAKYGVLVQDDGGADVTLWSKEAPVTARQPL